MTADNTRRAAAPAARFADPDPAAFLHRVLTVAGVVLLAVIVGWAFFRAPDVFFLFFAAVLLGILLRALADGLDRRVKLGPRWSLGLVVFSLVAALAAAAAVCGEVVAAQVDRVTTELPRAIDRGRAYLAEQEWGRQVLDHAPPAEQFVTGQSGNLAGTITRLFTTTLGFIGNLVVVAFLGLYVAADPRLYTEGAVRLLPPGRRDRGREVVSAVGRQLRLWLLARVIAMAAVGVMVAVGLWAIGLPEYLALALLAAVLDVVPFFGPLVAAVPAVLLGLLAGPATAAWVVALYLVVQTVESYVLSPVLQQQAVRLPPALAIAVIVLAWALFGVVAVLVVTPLTVAVMVAVRMLYVEDVLGDPGAAPPAD